MAAIKMPREAAAVRRRRGSNIGVAEEEVGTTFAGAVIVGGWGRAEGPLGRVLTEGGGEGGLLYSPLFQATASRRYLPISENLSVHSGQQLVPVDMPCLFQKA